MARKRMVTRTVTGTQAEIQIVTISATEITTIKTTVTGEYADNDKLMKAIKKQVETDDIKVLQILTSEKINKLFGMPEAKFMEEAIELDPETRKPLNADGDEADTEVETEEAETDAIPDPETEAPKTKGKRGSK